LDLGEVFYSVGNSVQSAIVPSGGASFFPAGVRVSARWTQQSDIALLALNPGWIRRTLGEDVLDREPTLSLRDRNLERHVRALLQEASEPGIAVEVTVPALVSLITVDLVRHFESSSKRPEPGPERLTPRQLRRVEEKVRGEPGAKLSLKSLAKEVGLSLHHFARAFRQSTGITPGQFVREERLRLAIDLLSQGDLPMQQISSKLGFANPSHFSQAFRSYTGVVPSEFRLQSKSEVARR
jgi:AraC family transcriptional regulator